MRARMIRSAAVVAALARFAPTVAGLAGTLLGLAGNAVAAPGDLDTTFGSGGRVSLNLGDQPSRSTLGGCHDQISKRRSNGHRTGDVRPWSGECRRHSGLERDRAWRPPAPRIRWPRRASRPSPNWPCSKRSMPSPALRALPRHHRCPEGSIRGGGRRRGRASRAQHLLPGRCSDARRGAGGLAGRDSGRPGRETTALPSARPRPQR